MKTAEITTRWDGRQTLDKILVLQNSLVDMSEIESMPNHFHWLRKDEPLGFRVKTRLLSPFKNLRKTHADYLNKQGLPISRDQLYHNLKNGEGQEEMLVELSMLGLQIPANRLLIATWLDFYGCMEAPTCNAEESEATPFDIQTTRYKDNIYRAWVPKRDLIFLRKEGCFDQESFISEGAQSVITDLLQHRVTLTS